MGGERDTLCVCCVISLSCKSNALRASTESVDTVQYAVFTIQYSVFSIRYSVFTCTHLNVSSIIVKSTNLPSSGTTSDVGGMISASSRKNTVSDSRMDMLNETCKRQRRKRERQREKEREMF